MKKISLFIYCAVIVLALSSCTTYKLVVPVGKWQSDDPSIMLDITDGERDHYGTYVRNGKEITIYFVFGHVSNLLSVYDAIVMDENFKGGVDDYEYFVGNWGVEDDKLYLNLKPNWRDMYGIDQIVFTKIMDYDDKGQLVEDTSQPV